MWGAWPGDRTMGYLWRGNLLLFGCAAFGSSYPAWWCLRGLFNLWLGYFRKATQPCAFAYTYARIGRLVRFWPGFYRFRVADKSAIGFSSSANIKAHQHSLSINWRLLRRSICIMAAGRGALRCAGFLDPW